MSVAKARRCFQAHPMTFPILLVVGLALIWVTRDLRTQSLPNTSELDVIVVPGGGQLKDGGVPVWVERRLDKAVELQRKHGEPFPLILSSGGGSGVVPPVLTKEGFIFHESSSCAKYLHEKQNVNFGFLLKEWSSYCTSGNAYFVLTQHVIPAKWSRIAVITSEFHMERTRDIFEWVFGSDGAGVSLGRARPSQPGSRGNGFQIEYHSVSDAGVNASALQLRITKEKQYLEKFRAHAKSIRTLRGIHHHIHFSRIYDTEHQNLFGKKSLIFDCKTGLYC